VIWALTEAMKRQPLNPRPDPAGNVAAYRDVHQNWHARSVPPGTEVAFPERLMMPHAATCAGRSAAARVLPGNVIDLAAARLARAGRAMRRDQDKAVRN
jgi:hypothetical protein